MASSDDAQSPTIAPSSQQTPSTAQAQAEAQRTLFETGLATRTAVMGATHTQTSLKNATPFTAPMQDYATAIGWGYIWQRGGISLQQRSLITIAMLAAMGKSQELGGHVRGGVRNGLSEAEIRETLVQVAGYAGFPAGMEAFRVAECVLDEMEQKGELPAGYREKEKEG